MRGPRIELSEATHHATARTTFRRPLFVDDEDRQFYLQLWAAQAVARGWVTLAFCLMPNHVHFLVQTPEADLGDGIAVAHWRYAIHLNRKVDATGHLFDDRFSNKLVLSDEHLTANLRPIPRNPVPSLCDHPEAWDWSSHNATAGTAPVPSWLAVEQALGHLHEDVEVARAAYLRLRAQSDEAVLQALACGARDDRWMVIAHDLHRIPVETLAAFIGRATSTTYRRLATARETQVTGT